jgi:hypothetical protein
MADQNTTMPAVNAKGVREQESHLKFGTTDNTSDKKQEDMNFLELIEVLRDPTSKLPSISLINEKQKEYCRQ